MQVRFLLWDKQDNMLLTVDSLHTSSWYLKSAELEINILLFSLGVFKRAVGWDDTFNVRIQNLLITSSRLIYLLIHLINLFSRFLSVLASSEIFFVFKSILVFLAMNKITFILSVKQKVNNFRTDFCTCAAALKLFRCMLISCLHRRLNCCLPLWTVVVSHFEASVDCSVG